MDWDCFRLHRIKRHYRWYGFKKESIEGIRFILSLLDFSLMRRVGLEVFGQTDEKTDDVLRQLRTRIE